MSIEWNESGMNALHAEVASRFDGAMSRGLLMAEDHPLDQATAIMATELSNAGFEPNPAELRTLLANRDIESAEGRRSDHMATIPFTVTWVRGQLYRLRNITDETIEMVTMTVDHPTGLSRDLPDNMTMGPGETHEFMIIGTFQTGTPSQVKVSWDVHPTPYAIPLAPNR